MSTLGFVVLFLALEISLFSAAASFLGGKLGYPKLISSARIAVFAVCGLLSLSVALLLYALFSHDFHLSYVADHSSRDMSPLYLLTSFYAGNEGSLLFWAWLLSIFAVVANVQNRARNSELIPFASSVIMAIEAFFLVLLVFVANPFAELSVLPADGHGLNPLLENVGMVLHPPVLLAGYVGFAIPFAFAIAALITRRVGGEWLTTVRRWVLISWLLLGVGNLIGAWWAYTELGWGGYWGWDPVENAGLMPWLMATAVLHASVLQRKRGMFKAWNMVLIILTFNLTIFGTFLTRSDFLSSVHTFGLSDMDPYFLTLLGVALIGPLILLLYRRDELKGEVVEGALISRENAFLVGNLILVFATLVVLLGTLLAWKQSMFNYWAGSTLFALIVLMGLCALIGWRRETLKNLGPRLLPAMLLALVAGLVLSVVVVREWYAVVLFSFCLFVLGTILVEWYRGVRARGKARLENPLRAFCGLIWANKPRYGGLIVHLGIVLICVGVIGSSFYQAEAEAVLRPGESMSIKDYSLTYEGMSTSNTPSRLIVSTTLLVYDGSKLIGELTAEKQYHRSYEQWVTEVAIRYGLWDDLYVILAGWDQDGTAAFKVFVNRLVTWIWIGGGVLLLGSLIALWPDRRKQRPAELVTRSSEKGAGDSDS